VPILTTCRRCGAEHEADRRAIVAGAWRLCPRCREADRDGEPPPRPCHQLTLGSVRRPLRAGNRPVCGRCLEVAL